MKNKIYPILTAFIFILLFISFAWNTFSAPFERDEGEYAYSAWLLNNGGTPYQDSFLQKPPMIIYTYFLAEKINPHSVVPPRALASIFTLLSSILIFLIAYKEWGKKVAIFSSFLFLPMINFAPLTPFAANTEKFMVLPILSMLFLFVYYKNSEKLWPYITSGILATCAIFYKPICLPVVLFILLFWLYEIYKKENKDENNHALKKILKIGFVFLFSSLISAFVLLIPFLKVWPKFFEEVFVFNISYASAFDHPFLNFYNYLTKFLNYWWILLFLFGGLFLKIPKKIFYYGTLIFISLLTVFSSPIGHYYLSLMPFLALFCGALFSSFIENSSEKESSVITFCVLSLILIFMIFPLKQEFYLQPMELTNWVYGSVNPFNEAPIVASHLAEVTNKNDLVFVAGSEPEIYFYADRRSDTRFVITYPLNLPTPYQEKYQKELISDLEKNPPKAIVLSERAMSGLWNEGSPEFFIRYFLDLIGKQYKIVGGYVWTDGNTGAWQDVGPSGKIDNASLLLLIKK